jgi:hypothetical protein
VNANTNPRGSLTLEKSGRGGSESRSKSDQRNIGDPRVLAEQP